MYGKIVYTFTNKKTYSEKKIFYMLVLGLCCYSDFLYFSAYTEGKLTLFRIVIIGYKCMSSHI